MTEDSPRFDTGLVKWTRPAICTSSFSDCEACVGKQNSDLTIGDIEHKLTASAAPVCTLEQAREIAGEIQAVWGVDFPPADSAQTLMDAINVELQPLTSGEEEVYMIAKLETAAQSAMRKADDHRRQRDQLRAELQHTQAELVECQELYREKCQTVHDMSEKWQAINNRHITENEALRVELHSTKVTRDAARARIRAAYAALGADGDYRELADAIKMQIDIKCGIAEKWSAIREQHASLRAGVEDVIDVVFSHINRVTPTGTKQHGFVECAQDVHARLCDLLKPATPEARREILEGKLIVGHITPEVLGLAEPGTAGAHKPVLPPEPQEPTKCSKCGFSAIPGQPAPHPHTPALKNR